MVTSQIESELRGAAQPKRAAEGLPIKRRRAEEPFLCPELKHRNVVLLSDELAADQSEAGQCGTEQHHSRATVRNGRVRVSEAELEGASRTSARDGEGPSSISVLIPGDLRGSLTRNVQERVALGNHRQRRQIKGIGISRVYERPERGHGSCAWVPTEIGEIHELTTDTSGNSSVSATRGGDTS